MVSSAPTSSDRRTIAARPGGPRPGRRARPAARPSGPVRMLTNLRYFGHCFNPVTFFFCFDEAGTASRRCSPRSTTRPGANPRVRDRTIPALKSDSFGADREGVPRLAPDGHGSRLRVAHDRARRRPPGSHREPQATATWPSTRRCRSSGASSYRARRPADAGPLPGDDRPGGREDLLAGAATAAQGRALAPHPERS